MCVCVCEWGGGGGGRNSIEHFHPLVGAVREREREEGGGVNSFAKPHPMWDTDILT